MDRVTQLRGEAGGSGDSSLASSPSEAYLTANDSSKYFSLSESDTSLEVSVAAAVEHGASPDQLADLSTIGKKSDLLDSYKIGKHIEAANILSGGVDIFDDDNDTSCDGNELIIDDNVGDLEDKSIDLKIVEEEVSEKVDESLVDSALVEAEPIPSMDTEVKLQIDGTNLNAIDIGNGLYLYRKGDHQEELAAVQIIDTDQQQPSFKFLKVRENLEGNLEVYEEIEVEVKKTGPKSKNQSAKSNASQAAAKDTAEVTSEISSQTVNNQVDSPPKTINPLEPQPGCSKTDDLQLAEIKSDVKTITTEAKVSPIIGFTPMTFHATPNKEGIPLTKTMVDQQLQPNRHSDNVKKTIEVNTDTCKLKLQESPTKDNTRECCKDSEKNVVADNRTTETAADKTEPLISSIEADKSKATEIISKDSQPKVVSPSHSQEPNNLAKIELKHAEKENKLINHNQVVRELDLIKGSPEKTVTAEATSTTNVTPKNEVIENKLTENTKKYASEPTCNSASPVANSKAVNSNLSDKVQPTNDIKSTIGPTENISEQVDQKLEEISEPTISSNSNISNATTDSNSSPDIVDKKVSNKIASPPKTQPSCDINMDHRSSPKTTEAFFNKYNDLAPFTAEATIDMSSTSTKDQNNYEKDSKEVIKSNEPKKSENAATKEEKNTSDELIQLNDLGVTVENEKPLEYEEPKEQIVFEETVTTIPIKLTKVEHETKFSTSTPNATHTNAKGKDPARSLIPGPHKITSNLAPLFTKTEQKPSNAIIESKPKVVDSTAFVNKYVNKALLIKSVTSGPVGDYKNANIVKSMVTSSSKDNHLVNAKLTISGDKKDVPKVTNVETKPKSINNNNAVPFGKWTEANKQAYLNKIKETKVVTNTANTNQIKQPYDLNRRDVLKKIDSQRQQVSNNNAARILEAQNKMNIKNETPMFVHKSALKPETKVTVKAEAPKPKQEMPKSVPKKDILETVTFETKDPSGSKPDKRKDIQTQDIINRTIEDILMDRKSPNESQPESKPKEKPRVAERTYNRAPTKSLGLVDDIEKKMNELHGIPHERLQEPRYNHDIKCYTKPKPFDYDSTSYRAKGNKIPSLVPISKPTPIMASAIDVDEEEVIEHQPVTGDMDLRKILPQKTARHAHSSTALTAGAKKDGVITENEFDKFARRNSITYKNAQTNNKFQLAYNSALTAKRHKESPLTVIEDKPVKVVYMDPNAEYITSRLNVQGKELSPAKKTAMPEADASTHSSCDSLDAEVLEVVNEAKSLEKSQTPQPPHKHQRKQVLTPVEAPDMEIVDPREISPSKKMLKDEPKSSTETKSKNVLPKKTYLLGRNAAEDNRTERQNTQDKIPMSNAAFAIDNLVKAAELLENQSKNMQLNSSNVQDSPQANTPVKRGRGRPRKNPLPESGENVKNKSANPSPQKKPRVSKPKPVSSSEESSDDDEVIVNWSMGKINENIVCPICNKLFRTENVVFKHVKHCTGPSPNRSETNTRSSRRTRGSFESNNSSQDISDSDESLHKISETKKKNAIKNLENKKENEMASETNKADTKLNISNDTPREVDEVITIEDTSVKKKVDKPEETKQSISKPVPTKGKLKQTPNTSNLVCEICGKTFRQLSYLVSHRSTHKKEDPKKIENDNSVFSCEVCKKDFRKLHHLVQHRIIHSPGAARPRRKSSADVLERNKLEAAKAEDQSAGFRCEPCDKSFRKLHHLVEHRETHDGINRQKTTSAPVALEKEKVEAPPPQCNICNKTFRKLHHLIEHKEQHNEASSEKSDDKSVKSSLSTKDIIHECSLCYMVFPNEHSLNKHSVNCQKKKRQSANKHSKPENDDSGDDVALSKIAEDVREDKPDTAEIDLKPEAPKRENLLEVISEQNQQKESSKKEPETKPVEQEPSTRLTIEEPKTQSEPEKTKILETIVIEDTPKKKPAPKDKVAATVTKRQKSTQLELPVIDEVKTPSDDDEIRYMFNPDFKSDDETEGKFFMKVRANKRNSLQIERPNSKNLITRRVSLQYPPKTPRLKPKKAEIIEKKEVKPLKPVATEEPSTDSDDSDVKYSFPEPEKAPEAKPVPEKPKRKSLSKRKSLGGIAKRKSLGKPIVSKSAAKAIPVAKPGRKRISEVEHRCDCGQLFSSAALLTRHASLAHTPPRIRRRRSPPPENKPPTKQRKSTIPTAVRKCEPKARKSEGIDTKTTKKTDGTEKTTTRKSETKSEVEPKPVSQTKNQVEPKSARKKSDAESKPARKSDNTSDAKLTKRKSEVPAEPKTVTKKPGRSTDSATPNKRQKKDPNVGTGTGTKSAKLRRSGTHTGVPVPDKMRRLMEKLKK